MTEPIEGVHDARGLRGVIVVSRFNEFVTGRLLQGALACLEQFDAGSDSVRTFRVPGAWELPLTIDRLLGAGELDYVVALGALIRGETYHFDVLADEVTRSLSEISRQHRVPVGLGLLTVETVDQAVARTNPGSTNKGWEATLAAIEMAQLLRQVG